MADLTSAIAATPPGGSWRYQHLVQNVRWPDLGMRTDRRSTAYLFVEDADALARTWLEAGADVRLPQDTEWGHHEGVLVDPDGNMIRFGSPMNSD